jgi:hypothetical protein
MAAGFHFMVSGILNSFGVQLDEGVPGWPKVGPRHPVTDVISRVPGVPTGSWGVSGRELNPGSGTRYLRTRAAGRVGHGLT